MRNSGNAILDENEHIDCKILFSPNEQCGGWGGGGMLPDFFFCSLFPVQQTTSGIGHRVK